MPTSRETVLQTPLRAEELRRIIMTDLDAALDRDVDLVPEKLRESIRQQVEATFLRDAMLTGTTAYGRLSYTLRVILHLADLGADGDEELFGRIAYEVALEMKLPIVAYPVHRRD